MKLPAFFRLLPGAALAALFIQSAAAQLTLTGTNYTQDFNDIGNSGLPTGWTVRSNATATTLGASPGMVTAVTSWGDTGLAFKNCASTINNSGSSATGSESVTNQSVFTNRAPAVRLGASFGDPGAAFVLQLNDTLGFVNFKLSLDFLMLSIQGRSNIWQVQYGIGVDGGNPTNFTTVATYTDPSIFGATHTNISLETALDNQSENVWIRVVTLSASGGSNSRDTFGIDNFSLSWSTGASSITNPPGIISQSGNTVAVVGSSPQLSVFPSGTPPFQYQWFKDGAPLTDGGNLVGATSNILSFTNVFHTNAGSYHLAITNAVGFTNSAAISLVVTGFTITHIGSTNTLSGVPLAGIPLTFNDPALPIGPAVGSSDNQSLLPDSSIAVVGAGNSRTVTVSPVAGQSGVAVVTLMASDGSFSTNTSFALVVVPSADVVFNDYFDYGDGALNTNSAFLWRNHSGTAGETQVTNHQLFVSQSLGEDVNAWFIQPFLTNMGAVVYSKLTVNFSLPPTNTTGAYFAHLKDETTTGFRARIWGSAANAAAGKFRLGIGNSSTSTSTTAQFPLDLDTNTTYTLVTKYNVDSGASTLWLNPTNESDTHVTAGDTITNIINIVSFAFRQIQGAGEGRMLIDDLVVGDSFAAVTAPVSTPSPVLQFQKSGGNMVLSWTNAGFSLFSGAAPTRAAMTNLIGGGSPSTNPITGAQQYFQLKK